MRRWLADRLRRAADRLDEDGAPRLFSANSFTFEDGYGIRWRTDGRGCPVWYYAKDYDRAFDESDAPSHSVRLPGDPPEEVRRGTSEMLFTVKGKVTGGPLVVHCARGQYDRVLELYNAGRILKEARDGVLFLPHPDDDRDKHPGRSAG